MFYNINIRWYNIVVKNVGANMDKKLVKNYIYSLTQKKMPVNIEDCEIYFNIKNMKQNYIDLYMEG